MTGKDQRRELGPGGDLLRRAQRRVAGLPARRAGAARQLDLVVVVDGTGPSDLTWDGPSIGVRSRPLVETAIVTQLVARPLARPGSDSEATLMASSGGMGRRGSRTPAVPLPGSSSIWRARASIRLSPSVIPMARSRPDSCRATSVIRPRSPERSRSRFSLYLRLHLAGPNSGSRTGCLPTASMIPCCRAGVQAGPSAAWARTARAGDGTGPHDRLGRLRLPVAAQLNPGQQGMAAAGE